MTSNAFEQEFHVGQRLPFMFGVKKDKSFYSLDQQAGRPAVLIVVGSLPYSSVVPLLSAFERRATYFAMHNTDLILVIDAAGRDVLHYECAPIGPIEFLFCFPRVFEDWGFDGSAPRILVIDRNARVIAPIGANHPDEFARLALECFADPTPSDGSDESPAPILVIPNVFSPALCRGLVAHFENSPHVKGGIASMDAAGIPYTKFDDAKKKRTDFVLQPDDPMFTTTIETLSRVCLPEIRRAFQFDACYTDRILLARYDADGGCFLRHRDNAAPGLAYRQFAVSINLNANEYDGGYLLFPEYNSIHYKTPSGTAVIFSATLLHEATHVLKGSRYVLLTFFHNAEAEARRLTPV